MTDHFRTVRILAGIITDVLAGDLQPDAAQLLAVLDEQSANEAKDAGFDNSKNNAYQAAWAIRRELSSRGVMCNATFNAPHAKLPCGFIMGHGGRHCWAESPLQRVWWNDPEPFAAGVTETPVELESAGRSADL